MAFSPFNDTAQRFVRLAALPLLQLLDSPILCDHDEDAWEIKFPISNFGSWRLSGISAKR
jgi:hypothetical protein